MKIYLFPDYVTIGSSSIFSQELFGLINELDIELDRVFWDGTLESLPTEPCIVRASTMLSYHWKDLAWKCKQLGHLCFYDGSAIDDDGERNDEAFLPRAKEFFKRCGFDT